MEIINNIKKEDTTKKIETRVKAEKNYTGAISHSNKNTILRTKMTGEFKFNGNVYAFKSAFTDRMAVDLLLKKIKSLTLLDAKFMSDIKQDKIKFTVEKIYFPVYFAEPSISWKAYTMAENKQTNTKEKKFLNYDRKMYVSFFPETFYFTHSTNASDLVPAENLQVLDVNMDIKEKLVKQIKKKYSCELESDERYRIEQTLLFPVYKIKFIYLGSNYTNYVSAFTKTVYDELELPVSDTKKTFKKEQKLYKRTTLSPLSLPLSIITLLASLGTFTASYLMYTLKLEEQNFTAFFTNKLAISIIYISMVLLALVFMICTIIAHKNPEFKRKEFVFSPSVALSFELKKSKFKFKSFMHNKVINILSVLIILVSVIILLQTIIPDTLIPLKDNIIAWFNTLIKKD